MATLAEIKKLRDDSSALVVKTTSEIGDLSSELVILKNYFSGEKICKWKGCGSLSTQQTILGIATGGVSLFDSSSTAYWGIPKKISCIATGTSKPDCNTKKLRYFSLKDDLLPAKKVLLNSANTAYELYQKEYQRMLNEGLSTTNMDLESEIKSGINKSQSRNDIMFIIFGVVMIITVFVLFKTFFSK